MRITDVSRSKLILFHIVLTCAMALIVFAPAAHAKELYEFYNGIREMGMGGASVAVVNDETALILNPAALGKLRNSIITVADPEVHMDSKAATTINSNNYDVLETTRPQELLDLMKGDPDRHFNSSATLFPSIVLPNFGIGLLGSYRYDAQYNSSNSTLDLHYRNDYAAILGYDFRFFDGILKIGFNAKYINRTEVDKNLPGSSTGLTWSNLVTEGAGLSSDMGVILTAPTRYLPTLAAVWRDIGDTCYQYGGMFYSGRPKPQSTTQTVDVGTSITPILGKYNRFQLTAEYQDILTADTEKDQWRRVHAGFEFNVYDRFFFRGGVNQRYWTAGLEIASEHLQFQVASWGEDVGTYPLHQEDRRYGVKFAFRF